MKTFYIIFLFIFLTSCGVNTATQVVNEASDTPVNIEQDVPTETEEISETEPEAPSEEPPVIDTTPEETVEAPSEEPPVIDANVQGTTEAPSEEPPVIDPVKDTTSDIDDEMEKIDSEEQDEVSNESSLIELSTTYTNPATEAIMNIEMSVGSDNVIQSISVTSPNYKGMPQFNNGVQAVVGMTVEKASEYYVSGSSLASPAFQKALKSSL